MKYYIISGEASGDLHGSNLIKQLLLLDANANVHCWGGDLMQAAGAKLIKHYKELAFMGFAEVIKNLPTIFRNIKFCKQDITNFKPDVLVLIDYPGFNLRIAEWAKQQGYKVVYYISPQVWAWKENRVKKMKLCIDKMLCILPFEKDYYQTKWNWNVEYVGHPLVEVIEEYTKTEGRIKEIGDRNLLSTYNKKIIALLPGSRKQEITKKLPIMLEVSKTFPNYQFVVAQAPGQDDDFYKPFLQPYNNVSTIKNNTYQLLMQSTAALVTSGTATLETALFAVPEVVCYKGSNISYQIAKRLIKIKYISLVNLIMDKLVVKELIQNELTVANITKELSALLNNTIKQQQLQNDYTDLKNLLSSGGNASAKAAAIIYNFTKCN
ncbi:MAG: lipid-A-disaccharide synthase [Bacteroidetes bacterium]|nr:lipid-A-disaccharide synthase [Bacteroidota bacterium]MBS1670300.1 lipid-A-disaccharide synthase [Bacteroidota bacterium]